MAFKKSGDRDLSPSEIATRRRRFLRVLSRTGNVTMAIAEAGGSRNWYYIERERDERFFSRWARAVALSQRRMDGRRGPVRAQGGIAARQAHQESARTTYAPNKNGEMQLRIARKHELTKEEMEDFLWGLTATANVRRAAASAGRHPGCFYNLLLKSPEFRKAFNEARAIGIEVVKMDALASASLVLNSEEWDERMVRFSMTAAEAIRVVELIDNKEAQVGKGCNCTPEIATEEESNALIAEVIAKFDAAAKQHRHEARLRREANREVAQAKQVAKRRAAKKGPRRRGV